MRATTYSLTEDLRQRVRAKLGGCLTCGCLSEGSSSRKVASSIGIAPSSLRRFLAGKSLSSEAIDKIARWLKVSLSDPVR